MSVFDSKTKKLLEGLLIQSGYVLDFTNSTFSDFIKESVGIDIYNDKNYTEDESKGKKLRQIWNTEPEGIVFKLTQDLIDYAEDYYLEEKKLDEIKKSQIAKVREYLKSRQGSDINLPDINNDDLKMLQADIKQNILKGTPELALDRLHTFTMKYIRACCTKHNIDLSDKNNNNFPLHSLLGMLIKYYKTDGKVTSDFSITALRMGISIFEKFNTIRNDQSFAHDNTILNKNESEFVLKTISNLLVFISKEEEEILQ